MPIVVVCAQCGHRAGAKEEWAGKRLKCPACGNSVTVPRPATPLPARCAPGSQSSTVASPAWLADAALDTGGDWLAGAAAAPAALGAGTTRKPSRKASTSANSVLLGVAVVGGLMLFACAGVIVVLLSAVPRTRKSASADVVQDQSIRVPAPHSELSTWTADAALTAQLGEEVTFGRYSMRLPKSFTPVSLPDPELPLGTRLQKWAWAGPASRRGDRPMICAVIVENRLPFGQVDDDLDKVAELFQQRMERQPHVAPPQVYASQKGTFLDKPFLRVQFRMSPSARFTIHGVALLGSDGNRAIDFQSSCTEDAQSDIYRLLETSLLTVREK